MEDLSGASTVSSEASSAPASDTAATSTSTPADASTASATSGAPEAAASTDSGADNAPAADLDEAALDRRFDDAVRNAPAEDEDEGDPEADTTAADKPEEGKPAEEPAPEETPEEADPLAEFEAHIPTREEINAKHARAPKAIRDEFAETAEKLAAREESVSKIGGEEGLKVAEAIAPHLFTAEPTPENATGMFSALVDTNPALVATMGQEFVRKAIEDERTGAEFGDRLLAEYFGEGYTKARIEELVKLDAEGLIDVDALREDLGTPREPTAREREQDERIKSLEAENKQLKGNSTDATRKAEQNLQNTLRSSVSDVVKAKVAPIAAKIGWEGEGMLGRLGALVTAELNQQIEATPEWAALQALSESGAAFRDGKASTMARVKLDAIGRRAEANFLRAAREFKPLLDMLAGKKTAAPKTPTSDTSRSGAPADRSAPPPRSTEQPKKAFTPEEQEAELDRKYETATRDARTAASRR